MILDKTSGIVEHGGEMSSLQSLSRSGCIHVEERRVNSTT